MKHLKNLLKQISFTTMTFCLGVVYGAIIATITAILIMGPLSKETKELFSSIEKFEKGFCK